MPHPHLPLWSNVTKCSNKRKNADPMNAFNICLYNYFKRIIYLAQMSVKHNTTIMETSPYKSNPDLHLTYSKNGGNLGLVLKMKNIACISISLTKHVKYTYLYLFKLVLYSIVASKGN